jgi:hypothetical protein
MKKIYSYRKQEARIYSPIFSYMFEMNFLEIKIVPGLLPHIQNYQWRIRRSWYHSWGVHV